MCSPPHANSRHILIVFHVHERNAFHSSLLLTTDALCETIVLNQFLLFCLSISSTLATSYHALSGLPTCRRRPPRQRRRANLPLILPNLLRPHLRPPPVLLIHTKPRL